MSRTLFVVGAMLLLGLLALVSANFQFRSSSDAAWSLLRRESTGGGTVVVVARTNGHNDDDNGEDEVAIDDDQDTIKKTKVQTQVEKKKIGKGTQGDKKTSAEKEAQADKLQKEKKPQADNRKEEKGSPSDDAEVDEEDLEAQPDQGDELIKGASKPSSDQQEAGEDVKEGSASETKSSDKKSKLDQFPECRSSRRLEHPGVTDGPRVQYIHVPKAGGTSIQAATVLWVRRAYGATLFKYDGNAVRGSSIKCPPQAFEATVLTGHRGFGYCDNIKKNVRGLFTFTAIREAVARMVSWYDYYLYDLREPRALSVFGNQDLPLKEIVKRYNATEEREWGEKLLRYAGQQQARFLCGYECMGPLAKGNKNYTEQFILNRALENLRKLDVVGIVDQMNDMILQLRFHMPQLVPKTFKEFTRDNTNHKKKTVLDDEARAILKEWGWVDATLYEEARKIFKEKQAIAEKCLRLFGELDDEDSSAAKASADNETSSDDDGTSDEPDGGDDGNDEGGGAVEGEEEA